jgi:hypothetical protein
MVDIPQGVMPLSRQGRVLRMTHGIAGENNDPVDAD